MDNYDLYHRFTDFAIATVRHHASLIANKTGDEEDIL